MKFALKNTPFNKNFTLYYDRDDYCFITEPFPNECVMALLVNDVQLGLDDNGTLQGLWGLCPLIIFNETDAFPQKFVSTALVALLEKKLPLGVCSRINQENNWPLFINKKNKWICIGDPNTHLTMVEFAPSCIASLSDDQLVALWLHPIVYGTNEQNPGLSSDS